MAMFAARGGRTWLGIKDQPWAFTAWERRAGVVRRQKGDEESEVRRARAEAWGVL